MSGHRPPCPERSDDLQAWADGELPVGDSQRIEEHAADCPPCAAEAGRLRANLDYLRRILRPLALDPQAASSLVERLPDRGRTEARTPRTVVMGGSGGTGAASGGGRRVQIAAAVGIAVALGAAAWAVFGGEPEPTPPPPVDERPPPTVESRPPRGRGAADPGATGDPGTKPPRPPRPAATDPEPPPSPDGVIRTAADLLRTLEGDHGGRWGPIIGAGWSLLLNFPAEAPAVREAAGRAKDPALQAALVLILGADGSDANRTELRGWLAAGAPEVRRAAVLGLARSLSFASPDKRQVPSGAPLSVAVDIGTLAEEAGFADLLGRLAAERDAETLRLLVLALGPTTRSRADVRQALVDVATGPHGDAERRRAALRGLEGVEDPQAAGALIAFLRDVGPDDRMFLELLRSAVAMGGADHLQALVDLVPAVEGDARRRALLDALARAAGGVTIARDAFLAFLSGSDDPVVRGTAAKHLERWPGEAVRDALRTAGEQDTDPTVRAEAERVAAALTRLLESPADE